MTTSKIMRCPDCGEPRYLPPGEPPHTRRAFPIGPLVPHTCDPVRKAAVAVLREAVHKDEWMDDVDVVCGVCCKSVDNRVEGHRNLCPIPSLYHAIHATSGLPPDLEE